jgi:hypothetical protein
MPMIAALKICKKQVFIQFPRTHLATSFMHQITNWHRFCLSGLGVLL